MNIIKVALFCIFFNIYCGPSESAKILCGIPTPSYSHQIPFRALWRELALRGHEVTVLTTDPVYNSSLKNLKEIDLSGMYEIMKNINFFKNASDAKSGALFLLQIVPEIKSTIKIMTDALFGHQEVKELLNNKEVHFDLVIAESLYPGFSFFSWIYKCPWIGVISLDAPSTVHAAAGNPTHPILYPSYNLALEDPDNLNFHERTVSTLMDGFSLLMKWFMVPLMDETLREYFGKDMPGSDSMFENMSMLFLNYHPLFYNPRPVNPNTLLIGSGLHIQEAKKLPKELKSFLDEAKNGAIYFSLGSNVKTDFLGANMTMELLTTLGELPYKVLWRCDLLNMSLIPSNIKIMKWFPQQDILRHPNIKLFITQGGLQSLEEAITFGVPVLGIPFFGDQFYNVKRMAKRGIGIELKRENLNKESLTESIQEVINNPKYKETSIKMGKILHDRPMTGIEEAVWWTEYVIRNRGASHLKNPSANIPLYQYLLLDVIAFLLLMVVLIFFLLYFILKLFIKLVVYTTRLFRTKTKNE